MFAKNCWIFLTIHYLLCRVYDCDWASQHIFDMWLRKKVLGVQQRQVFSTFTNRTDILWHVGTCHQYFQLRQQHQNSIAFPLPVLSSANKALCDWRILEYVNINFQLLQLQINHNREQNINKKCREKDNYNNSLNIIISKWLQKLPPHFCPCSLVNEYSITLFSTVAPPKQPLTILDLLDITPWPLSGINL